MSVRTSGWHTGTHTDIITPTGFSSVAMRYRSADMSGQPIQA